MFAAVAFLLLGIASLEHIRRDWIAAKVEAHAFKLYALRDELRGAVIRGEVKSSNWVFAFLDSSIAKTVRLLPRINGWVFLGIAAVYRHDEGAAMASEHLHGELEKPGNAFLKQVHKRYVDTLVSLILAQHPLVRRLLALITERNDNHLEPETDVAPTGAERLARIVVESPEASTLDEYVNGLRLAS